MHSPGSLIVFGRIFLQNEKKKVLHEKIKIKCHIFFVFAGTGEIHFTEGEEYFITSILELSC